MMILTGKFELTLSDVFKIESGLKILSGKDAETVNMINPSMIPKLEYYPITESLMEVKTSNIKPERFLSPNDYLISSKQNIRGYSLLNTNNIEGNFVVASEHFIVLKYKPTWNAIFGNSYLVHKLLDLLVKKLAAEKSKKSGNQKYITIDDVSRASITLNLDGNSEIDNYFYKIRSLILENLKGINDLKKIVDNYINENEIEINVGKSDTVEKVAFINQLTGDKEFFVKLGTAYYNQPFFNVKRVNEELFGEHLTEIDVFLGSWDSNKINAKVNRKANPNKTPRIIFEGSDFNRFVQSNHEIGDYISITIANNENNKTEGKNDKMKILIK